MNLDNLHEDPRIGYLHTYQWNNCWGLPVHTYGHIENHPCCDHPHVKETLSHPLNKRDAKSLSSRSYQYKEGEISERFCTLKLFQDAAEKKASEMESITILLDSEWGETNMCVVIYAENEVAKEELNAICQEYVDWIEDNRAKNLATDWDKHDDFIKRFKQRLLKEFS